MLLLISEWIGQDNDSYAHIKKRSRGMFRHGQTRCEVLSQGIIYVSVFSGVSIQ